MSGFTVPFGRRLRNILGQALLAACALATVTLLALILGLLVRRGGPVALRGLGLEEGLAAVLQRTQLVPLAANLAIAFLLGAALALPVSRALRKALASAPGARASRFAIPPFAVGFLAALLMVGAVEPGLALGSSPIPVPVVLLVFLGLLGRLVAAASWPAALRRLLAPALWVLGALAVLALLEASLDWQFFQSFSSSKAANAGVKAAVVGSLWISAISLVVAVPVGILAAVYLNEFARPSTLTTLLRASIANLAGVPSIVFGILGLAIFVRAIDLGNSVLAAGLTLGILTLPLVIVVCEEALRAVPQSVREAAFGLGARRWQAVRHHVLPYALPGMLTAAILAFSRAMGETAPILVVGAAGFIDTLPQDADNPLKAKFTALPFMAWTWAEKPGQDFHDLAWAAVLVLVALVLVGNLAAILLRDRAQKRIRW